MNCNGTRVSEKLYKSLEVRTKTIVNKAAVLEILKMTPPHSPQPPTPPGSGDSVGGVIALKI